MKPVFEERMKQLLPDAKDFDRYSEIIHTKPLNYIRCNTLKISSDELFLRLKKRWNVVQLFPKYPEIILIDQELGPGELGNAIEHLLGYYYLQEIASMLPAIALNPKQNELVLDLCAAPGSKTTQMAAMMKNKGTIIANDSKLDRIKILASNLERCGVTNAIITRTDGIHLCRRMKEENFLFDKILVDAPCSGEGTIRSSKKTLLMWNINAVNGLSKVQKKLLDSGDKEAMMPDWEFVEMLEHGMPPTCGFGFGERLFAILANKPARETQMFPLMRPKDRK